MGPFGSEFEVSDSDIGDETTEIDEAENTSDFGDGDGFNDFDDTEEVECATGDTSEVDEDSAEKGRRFDGVSYHQGNNMFGAEGTCGETSVANALNRVEGTSDHTENEVVTNAWYNDLCNKSDNPRERGGTSTEGVVELIDNVKDPESNVHSEVYENDNVLSVDELADRTSDDSTVAIVGVDSKTLWDETGDVSGSGLFREDDDGPSDHWIVVDSPEMDENGEVAGFNIIDSGGGEEYVDREKFDKMYKGDFFHRVTDPTTIIVTDKDKY